MTPTRSRDAASRGKAPVLLPIRDIQARGRRPWAHQLALAAIVVVFGYQVWLGQGVQSFVATYGLVPARLSAAWADGDPGGLGVQVSTIFTSAFLHGGYLHVLGNLLYLGVFGERVEARLGPWRFAAFYGLAVTVGAMAQIASAPADAAPIVGASGGIAGILGLFVILFPTARITTLFPAFVTLTFIELPALLFVALWAAQQALNGYLVLAEGLGVADVAWFAHLGGFATGLVVGGILRLGARRGRGKEEEAR